MQEFKVKKRQEVPLKSHGSNWRPKNGRVCTYRPQTACVVHTTVDSQSIQIASRVYGRDFQFHLQLQCCTFITNSVHYGVPNYVNTTTKVTMKKK